MCEHTNVSLKLAWAYRYKPWRVGRPWAECSGDALSKGLRSRALEVGRKGRLSSGIYYSHLCSGSFRHSPSSPRMPRGQGSTDHQRGSVVMCHKAQGFTYHLSFLRIKILWAKIIKRKKK